MRNLKYFAIIAIGSVMFILGIIGFCKTVINLIINNALVNLEIYVAEDTVYAITPQGEIHEYDYVEWEGDM